MRILEAMSGLKLYGMHASFDETAGKGLARRDELYPLIASLIRAERTHGQARSISYRISGAKFPVLKDLDKFVFADTVVDEGQVGELATGAFLDAKRNAIFIGGTGTGKTHLCIGVASAIIRSRARGRSLWRATYPQLRRQTIQHTHGSPEARPFGGHNWARNSRSTAGIRAFR